MEAQTIIGIDPETGNVIVKRVSERGQVLYKYYDSLDEYHKEIRHMEIHDHMRWAKMLFKKDMTFEEAKAALEKYEEHKKIMKDAKN